MSLHSPESSAWKQLLSSSNNQGMITMTGLDINTFNWLTALFKPIHDEYSPFVSADGRIKKITKNRGRPRLLSAEDCLGLCLAWTRTRGSVMVLQMIFGLTRTPIGMYLRFGRRILIKVLQGNSESSIRIPSDDNIRQYCEAIQERHPVLDNVWSTMDGLKLKLQAAANNTIQNNYYNGWTHDHYVSCVIVFCPDGTIPIICFNVPGSVHDSKVAEWGNIYQKLEAVYERTGARCTVDSAFSLSNKPFLIKSSQRVQLEHDDAEEYRRQLALNAAATSMRQASEWGMRAIQSSFPRLKDRFLYEEYGERRLILKMMFLLYNLRARKVGINQIKNVYMPALSQSANEMFADPVQTNML
jgi:DDE superfamily endonuclease